MTFQPAKLKTRIGNLASKPRFASELYRLFFVSNFNTLIDKISVRSIKFYMQILSVSLISRTSQEQARFSER